jgi:hypothetical protein
MARRVLRNSHQTTIRFTKGLWVELEVAAARNGVSVAQYVRDAARARLGEEQRTLTQEPGEAILREVERQNAVERSLEHVESSAALWEQGRLARERAKLLREESQTRRSQVR